MAPCPRWVRGNRPHYDEVEVELHQQGEGLNGVKLM